MKRNQTTLKTKFNTILRVLYIAFELGDKTWKLAFGDGEKVRIVTIEARNLVRLREEIERTKKRFKMSGKIRIVSCYEAGRDGFWLHRYLLSIGIENVVVDSSSIEVSRRAKHKKTDKIDARKLLLMLIRYYLTKEKVWSVLHVPSEEAEDGMRLHRELQRMRKERTAHSNRIGSLLALHGIVGVKIGPGFPRFLEDCRLWNGKGLPPDLKSELSHQFDRWSFVCRQIKELEAERKRRLAEVDSRPMEMVRMLMNLYGIGIESAWLFVMEFFSWRDFKNGKQVGGATGLTGTPFNSGGIERDQGISKAGNWRVRSMAVEIAWLWVRWQPDSRHTKWYNRRFAGGGKRMRKIGIVGVARKMMIELWHYVEHGVVPEGARFKAA